MQRAWLLSLSYNNGEEVTEHETHTRPVFYSFISSQYKARPLSTEYNLALDAARSFFTTLTILLSECKNLSHTLPLAHSHAQHTLPRHVIDLVRSFKHVSNVTLIVYKAVTPSDFYFLVG